MAAPLSLTVHITPTDAVRIAFGNTLRRPISLLIVAGGAAAWLYLAGVGVGAIEQAGRTPPVIVYLAVASILYPPLVAYRARRHYRLRPSLQQPLTYHFGKADFKVSVAGKEQTYAYSQLHSAREGRHYLVLRLSRMQGHYLPKRDLTEAQLAQLRAHLKKVAAIKA